MSAIDTLFHVQLGEICRGFPVYMPVFNKIEHCAGIFAKEAQVDPVSLFQSEYVFIGGGSGEFPAGGILIDDAILVFGSRSFFYAECMDEWEQAYFDASARPIQGWSIDSYMTFCNDLKTLTGPQFNGSFHELVQYTLGKIIVTHLPSTIWPEGSVLRDRHSRVKALLGSDEPRDESWDELADRLFNINPECVGGKLPTSDPKTVRWQCGIEALIEALPAQ